MEPAGMVQILTPALTVEEPCGQYGIQANFPAHGVLPPVSKGGRGRLCLGVARRLVLYQSTKLVRYEEIARGW